LKGLAIACYIENFARRFRDFHRQSARLYNIMDTYKIAPLIAVFKN
jgi:hypothetical protein